MTLIKVKSRGTDNVSGRKNIIINGAMQVAQRGTDIDDIATDGQKNMDMFVTRDYGGNGTYDFDQSTDVPDSTFHNSLKLTVKSASTNTGSYGYALEHRIEGYNMRQLRLGRSTAQPITVSFYVKSSVASTMGLRFTHEDGGEAILNPGDVYGLAESIIRSLKSLKLDSLVYNQNKILNTYCWELNKSKITEAYKKL